MNREVWLEAAIREDVGNLWLDLSEARRMSRAGPGHHTMTETWIHHRIRSLEALVGPTSWEQISIPFLLEYERLHRSWGTECEATRIDWERVSRIEAQRMVER